MAGFIKQGMTKKRILIPFICLVLLTRTLFITAQSSKPNVLFVVIDDLNDYMSLLQNYPGLKTPNLEKFAKKSLTFTKAYCAAPLCNPSRAAFLSGVAPYQTGIYTNENPLHASPQILNTTFLPEHFKANGYTTITRGKIFHTIPGAERFHGMWDDDGGKGNYGPYTKEQNVPKTVRHPVNFNYQPWLGPEVDHPDNVTALFTIDRLNKAYDKPFFLTCGFYKPHNPWTAPKRFFDMYPLENITLPEVLENDWDDLPPIAKKWADSPVDFEALKKSGQWKPIVRSYLACISFMDWNLGRILEALDNSRHKNNTIVCLLADNGFHLGEKMHFTKFALWEQTTHIIHIWRVPGVTPQGAVCQRTVNLLDIYPTLVELCGLSTPKQKLDGRSIVTLLKNPAAVWNYPSITTYQEGNQSIRTEKHRYIRYSDGEEELYDEVVDPREWKNLAKDPKMQTVIALFRKQVNTQYVPAASVNGKTEKSID